MKKTRILAIILSLVIVLQGMPLTMGYADQTDTIVLYPEYPEKIEQDYMYRVYISQGGNTYEIPVYNSMRHVNHYVREAYGTYSEADRRFCQFSATPSADNPVTVKVVANIDFTTCSVIPSVKGISPTVSSNEITFEITESGQYVFRLNDNNITNLAIFADAVETDVPDRNAENVVVFNEQNPAPNAIGTYSAGATAYPSDTVFFIEGWQDVELFELQSGQQLYIAPGAVLNARVQIMKGNSNVKIFGRGMLRDFNDTRAYNGASQQIENRRFNYLLTVGSSWYDISQPQNVAKNVTIKDIVLFDAKGFNLVFCGADECSVDNIKVVSNEISTDGISFWNCANIDIRNSYLYVADNIFVIDASRDVTMDNLLVGSSIATFFPQSTIRGTHSYSNINIFRSATIFEPAGGYKQGTAETDKGIFIRNLSAIDCVAANGSATGNKTGKFFSTYEGSGNSNTLKCVSFENVTLPVGNNSYIVEIGVKNSTAGNYNVTLKNVYVGETALTEENLQFTDATTSGMPSSVSVTNDGTYTPVTKSEAAASHTAYKTYIGDTHTARQYFALTQPYAKNGVVYISAETTAKTLGFNTYFDPDDNSLAIYDENLLVRVTVGSDEALYNDSEVLLNAPVEMGEEIMVPVDLFQKTVANKTQVNGYKITVGNYDRCDDENLVENGDFEDKYALESWTTVNFARLTRSTEAHDGSYALRFADSNIFKASSMLSQKGAYQDVREIVRQNGAGVYRMTFWAKCNDTDKTDTDLADTSKYNIFASVIVGWPGTSPTGGASKKALTTSWQQYTQDIFIGRDSGSVKVNSPVLYATIMVNGATDVSVDNFTFTKISDISTNSGNPNFNITTYAAADASGDYSLNYGEATKNVSISGTNTGIPTITYETTSDYITLGETAHTTLNGVYTATASVSVKYPSNYERTARISARGGSGNIVGEITVKIPAETTDVRHVVDYTSNLEVNRTYNLGSTLDTNELVLTNVRYNDGTTGTVSSGITVSGADFTTVGEKTVTVTYDNKSVSYTTTVSLYESDMAHLGTGIRIDNGDLSAGFRFGANVNKSDLYNMYYGQGLDYVYNENNNYQFGAIMVETDRLEDGKTVVDLFEEGNEAVRVTVAENVYEQDANTFSFTAVITDIPETKEGYTNTIQCVFYIKTRESADGKWTYIYSTPTQESYYSVAEKAYYNDYVKRESPTEEEQMIRNSLEQIVDLVEDSYWIGGWY